MLAEPWATSLRDEAVRILSTHRVPNSFVAGKSYSRDSGETTVGPMNSTWRRSGKRGEVKKRPWTLEEDIRLLRYIGLHGEGRWSDLAKASGLQRCGKSCRLRWLNYLHPGLKRGRITPDEERVIMELHARWGNRWSLIAQNIPGRTDNEIKNYWRSHIRKRIDATCENYTNRVLINSTESNIKPDSLAALSAPAPREMAKPVTRLVSSCASSSKRNITKQVNESVRVRSVSPSSSESSTLIHESSSVSTCSGGSKIDKEDQTSIKPLPATQAVDDRKTFKGLADFISADAKVEADQTLYKCPSPEHDAFHALLYQLYSGIGDADCSSANEVLTAMLAYSSDQDACPEWASDALWNMAPSHAP